MTKKQKRSIVIIFIVGTLCLALPYIFYLLDRHEKLIRFEGVIHRTELKTPKESSRPSFRWSKILIKEKPEYFWIYLNTDGKEETFMVSSYPDLTKKLQTLQTGDPITILASKDILGRGHYFPKIIQRKGEMILSQDDMKQYWDRTYSRLLSITGFVLYLIAVIEFFYYRAKKKKENATSEFA